ncbi:MAG: glycosyltransferase family 4 protein [Oscillospiraceae bacterium]
MKILHVLAQMPGRTGSGVYFCNLIDQLKPCGAEQRALYACQDGSAYDGLAQEACYPVCFKSPALPFPVPGMSDVMPYESTVYAHMDAAMLEAWQAAFRRALVQAKAEFAPDAVLLHHLWMLAALGVEVFEDALTIGICHQTDIRQAQQHPALKAACVQHLDRLDAVWALGEAQKPLIEEIYAVAPEKIVTMGVGYDANVFYPAEKPREAGPVRVVYAGKVVESKGVFELVRAFKGLGQNTPPCVLEIIGEPDAHHEALLARLIGGDARITVTPARSQADFAATLRQKDVFVMPSHYEGVGLVALEALACGLWTVSTRVEGLAALLGDVVNQSGAIAYVPPPRLHDVDKIEDAQRAVFTQALCVALARQVENVAAGRAFPRQVGPALAGHTWGGLASRAHGQIEQGLKTIKIT